MADEPKNVAATPEQLASVSQAGAEAAAEANTPDEAVAASKGAMRAEADRVGLELSDDDINRIADVFVDRTVREFQSRGAFDSPPEAVQPPATLADPEPATAATATGGPAEAGPPQKRSWAQRFLGE